MTDPYSSSNDLLREQVLDLLNTGHSVAQIAALLNLSKGQIQRWRHQHTSSAFPFLDGRRLYDDTFKQEALRLIHNGSSIRQVAQSLGVSQITLHKWRRELDNRRMGELMLENSAQHAGGQVVSVSESPSDESFPNATNYLLRQLQLIEQERDILKKAILILLRPD